MNHALSNLLRDAQACHEREPQNVPLIRDMCRALVAHQFEDAALPWTERGLALTPHDAEFVHLRVNALNLVGRHAEAAALLMAERSLLWPPAAFELKLGYSLMMAGDLEQAIARLDEAGRIAHASNHALIPKAAHLLGEALLKHGDGRGFAFWTMRNLDPGAGGSYCAADISPWSREDDLRGKRVLITHQLGFGDQFLLAAALADFQAAGASLLLMSDPQIHRLMQASLPDIEVISAERPLEMGEPLPAEVHAKVAAFSPDFQMPSLFAPVLASDQASRAQPFRPYMRAPADKRAIAAAWSQQLRTQNPGKRLVGLFWDCSQRHSPEVGSVMRCWAARRSIPLEGINRLVLDPAVTRPVQFVNLHHPLVEPMAGVPAGDVVRYSPGVFQFDDTAACIGELDAVISVDSSVANLAAMMGKPTCVAVNTTGDWRWGSAGAATPWIGGVTVLRQKMEGDWAPVLRDMAAWLG
ncbi:TPR repeat-containing protein [Caballeronia glebae]|uniref:TPR repeat-containing protein n=1 Tax=Caballeronia glebae TaxID=1777143 RepID=A0A158BHX3_9BURK|nr:TPR repeat-containing protein [Caballeronia glebae]